MKLHSNEISPLSEADDCHAAGVMKTAQKQANGKAGKMADLASELAAEAADAAERACSDAQTAVALAKAIIAANGPAFSASEEALVVVQEAFARAQGTMSLAHDCALAAKDAWELIRLEEEKMGRSSDSGNGRNAPAFSMPKWAWASAVALLVALLGLSALFGYAKYRARQLDELVTVAEQALTKGDYAQASLIAQRALQVDKNCRRACEVMAKLGEQVGDGRAVRWRQKATEISPDSLSTDLALASTALRFNQIDIAVQALAEVRGANREHPDFLATSGALALATNDRQAAERYYAQASQLAPDNADYRFALAKIQAESNDYFSRDAGRQVLSALAADPELGAAALRALIASYKATREPLAALRASAKLIATPGHVFADRLLRLSLLAGLGASGWATELAAAQDESAKNPKDAAALVLWMVDAGRAADALDWITRRTPEVEGFSEVRPALTACYATLGKWDAVMEATGSEWAVGEPIRHAYRSRALREQGQMQLSQSEWYVALTSAGRTPEAIRWLASVALEWQWEAEEEQALLMAIETQSKPTWALRRLSSKYSAKGDTAALRRVAAMLMEADPRSGDARNDYAFLSLLLFQDMERASRLARDLCQEYPENAAYASTHALALHLYGRSEEALNVMKKLPPERLEEPSIAAYYAILLVANHEPARAIPFLRLAGNARFLPEERRMITEAANAVTMVAGPL